MTSDPHQIPLLEIPHEICISPKNGLLNNPFQRPHWMDEHPVFFSEMRDEEG